MRQNCCRGRSTEPQGLLPMLITQGISDFAADILREGLAMLILANGALRCVDRNDLPDLPTL